MPSIITKAIDLFSGITTQWQRIPPWTRIASLFTITASGILTATFIDGYRKWKAMGAGGLPHNLKGYLMNLFVATTLAWKDTMSVEVYKKPEKHSAATWEKASEAEKAAAYAKFLKSELPIRSEPQARAKVFVIPQRERNEGEEMDESVKEAYLAAIDKLHEDNADVTEWKTSVLEKRGRALFLKPFCTPSTLAAQTQGEICHVHGSDLSGHVTLSFADARDAISRGWCERHRLSGTRMIPLGYTMTFVPRTVEEVEVFVRIFQAGIDYMRYGK